MTCMVCGKNLSECECPDLPERIEAIKPYVAFTSNEAMAIEKQVQRVLGLRELNNIGK